MENDGKREGESERVRERERKGVNNKKQLTESVQLERETYLDDAVVVRGRWVGGRQANGKRWHNIIQLSKKERISPRVLLNFL